ncbi:MAG: VOC family protein [Candidatus Saccharimonadales bacterium]
MKELLGDYDGFVTNVSDGLRRCGIGRDEIAMMDHICYRVETLERYDEMKAALGKCAFLLGESMVSGRLIATFECEEPLQADGWTIPYIELPQPKESSPYPEGLEHVELVPFRTLRKFQKRHSGLPFDEAGMGKLINPELGLKHEGVSVKFHEQPLGAVVNIERRLEGKIQL